MSLLTKEDVKEFKADVIAWIIVTSVTQVAVIVGAVIVLLP